MLLKQTLLYLPAQVIGPVFLFLSVVVWTHWLSPADLGLFSLIVAAQELLHVGIAWFSFYTLRYGAGSRDGADREAYLRTEAAILALGCLAAVVAAVTLRFILGAERMTFGLTAVTAAFMATRSITAHLADRARAGGDVASYSALTITIPVAGLLLGIAAVSWIAPTAASALAGAAAAQLLALLLVIRRLAPEPRFWRWDAPTIRSAVGVGAL